MVKSSIFLLIESVKMGFFDLKSTVYYPDSFSSALLKDKVENYRRILIKLGLRPSMLKELECSGSVLINAGYEKEARKLARINLEVFGMKGVNQIIISDPLTYKTFSQDYTEMLPDWDLKTEFILDFVLNKLRENPNIIKKPADEFIVYADPCYLGRYCGIYEPPRQILAILGYEVVELENSREYALCDGTCGGLKQTNPELANKIAKLFLSQMADLQVKKIVTPDPQSYLHLKENSDDIEVLEFSDVLCDALGIRRSV